MIRNFLLAVISTVLIFSFAYIGILKENIAMQEAHIRILHEKPLTCKVDFPKLDMKLPVR